MFEPYDFRMGCLAIRCDEQWWVVYPNGEAQRAQNEYEAHNAAMYNNLTATDEERETWKGGADHTQTVNRKP